MARFNKYFSVITFTLAILSLIITVFDLVIDIHPVLLSISGYTTYFVSITILLYFILILILSIFKKYDELRSVKYSIFNLITLIITSITFLITLYSLGKLLQNF